MREKWNLTKSEQGTYAANVERLKSAGVAIGVENAASPQPTLLRIEQSGHSEIYAGTLKGMALAICVHLVPLKAGIVINDCEIAIPGCDAKICLVEPPDGSGPYRAFGWLVLERGAVLNHLVFSGRSLPIDRKLDGLLVAQSFDPLPSQFQRGMPIGATIRLADQLGNGFTSEVELLLQRCEQSRGRHEERSTRVGAFDGHSSPELNSRDPKPMGGIASAKNQVGRPPKSAS